MNNNAKRSAGGLPSQGELRQQQLTAIAAGEVDPGRFGEFAPITKGPLYAIAGLFMVALTAIFRQLLTWPTRGRKSDTN